MINKQLMDLIKIFNEYKINYWLDGGALLGIVRDGKLIEADGDIDFGIFVEDFSKIKNILNLFKKEYKIHLKYYHDKPFALYLSPKKRGLSIDINFFYKKEDYFYSIVPEVYKRMSFLWILFFIPRFFYFKFMQYSKEIKTNSKSFITRIYCKRYYGWRVPSRNLSKLEYIKIEKEKIKIPYDVHSYLKFKYGSWKIPRSDWIWERDDGSVDKKKSAEEIFN